MPLLGTTLANTAFVTLSWVTRMVSGDVESPHEEVVYSQLRNAVGIWQRIMVGCRSFRLPRTSCRLQLLSHGPRLVCLGEALLLLLTGITSSLWHVAVGRRIDALSL